MGNENNNNNNECLRFIFIKNINNVIVRTFALNTIIIVFTYQCADIMYMRYFL